MDTKVQTATPAKAKLAVRNLNFFYGKFQGLKNVNMNIEERKVTAFIGPSGCGKSTFLRCFNRMNDTIGTAKVTGLIELDGEDIHGSRMDVVQLRARVGVRRDFIALCIMPTPGHNWPWYMLQDFRAALLDDLHPSLHNYFHTQAPKCYHLKSDPP